MTPWVMLAAATAVLAVVLYLAGQISLVFMACFVVIFIAACAERARN